MLKERYQEIQEYKELFGDEFQDFNLVFCNAKVVVGDRVDLHTGKECVLLCGEQDFLGRIDGLYTFVFAPMCL